MSARIVTVTLCGADDQTDPLQLKKISSDYTVVEWGILLHPERHGQLRYPSHLWIKSFLAACPGVRRSLHICGPAVYDFIDGDADTVALAKLFDRIQLNIVPEGAPVALDALEKAVSGFLRPVILPLNPGIGPLTSQVKAPNRQIIFDQSAGTGKLAAEWPKPVAGVACAYAGGLGPETLPEQLPHILEAAAGHEISIDMESRLRGANDEFSLDRVLSVLQIVERIANH